MKKFVKRTEGFTLVEMIVVIAILGILAGVGTVGYSGYIKKANMAADQQLVGSVKNALELAAISNMDQELSGGAIVLKKNAAAEVKLVDTTDTAMAELLENAMVAVFGSNWKEVCRLQYDGWENKVDADAAAAYNASSFAGNEKDLLNNVGGLTSVMTDFFGNRNYNNLPTAMKEFLNGNDDPTSVANSAALVLAQGFAGENDVSDDVTGVLSNMIDISTFDPTQLDTYLADATEDMTDAYKDAFAGTDNMKMIAMANAATFYAYAEAFAQFGEKQGYTGASERLKQLRDSELDAEKSSTYNLDKVTTALKDIILTAAGDPKGGLAAQAYFSGGENSPAATDAEAFTALMGALNANESALKGNIGSSSFYTDGKAANMLTGYIVAGSLAGGLDGGAVAVTLNQYGGVGYNPMDLLD